MTKTEFTKRAREEAERYGDKMKSLMGQFLTTAERLALAHEAGASWGFDQGFQAAIEALKSGGAYLIKCNCPDCWADWLEKIAERERVD